MTEHPAFFFVRVERSGHLKQRIDQTFGRVAHSMSGVPTIEQRCLTEDGLQNHAYFQDPQRHSCVSNRDPSIIKRIICQVEISVYFM